MPPVDPAVADALRAVAAKREEQRGAEFRNDGRGEKKRCPLDIEQDAVGIIVGQTA
jgi:hypothetical protein